MPDGFCTFDGMKKVLLVAFILLRGIAEAQNQNSVWIFGDSAGIDFSNLSNPVPITSANESRGTCVSISDTVGQLLFYAYSPEIALWQSGGTNKLGIIKNKFHQKIPGGDSLIAVGWYHEMLIIPFPNNDSLYYLFHIGVTSNYGLYNSIININSDSVIQKNIQLQSFPMVDCLTAVKHGNGRDWWLVFRRWYQTFTPTNEFFTYLISPAGITNFTTQTIGATHQANSGQLTFSTDGNKLVFTNLSDLIEIMDFDRCTGLLSNPVIIQPANPPASVYYTWSSAFSPNDSVLYVSATKDTSYLYQFDLTAPNILASRITLDTFYLPPVSPGALKLAPDGKIYFSCAYDNGVQFNYPYADSMYNYVNMNLSVINYPDSLGTACGYAPFSFYLVGKRTYYGLPNNPDYELGALTGSICDSLTSIAENVQHDSKFKILPNPNDGNFTINFELPQNRSGTFEIFDINGRKIFSQILPQWSTLQQINLPGISNGLYNCVITSGNERVSRKVAVLRDW